jgi:hypothetical protein
MDLAIMCPTGGESQMKEEGDAVHEAHEAHHPLLEQRRVVHAKIRRLKKVCTPCTRPVSLRLDNGPRASRRATVELFAQRSSGPDQVSARSALLSPTARRGGLGAEPQLTLNSPVLQALKDLEHIKASHHLKGWARCITLLTTSTFLAHIVTASILLEALQASVHRITIFGVTVKRIVLFSNEMQSLALMSEKPQPVVLLNWTLPESIDRINLCAYSDLWL